MRILCITPYPHHSADTRYRIEQYLPGLAKAGIHAVVRPFMSERLFKFYAERGNNLAKLYEFSAALSKRLGDVLIAGEYDLIFLHKEAFMFGPPWLEQALKTRAGALVLDIDDAYWSHPPQLIQIGKILRDTSKTNKIIAFSDHILAGNGFIANYVHQINPHVTVLPTVIDTIRYQPANNSNHTEVIVGWVGRWSSAFYLNSLIEVFQELCSRHPQVQIKLIGAGPKNWPRVRLISQPWSLETEIEDLQSFTIGLMPLANDDYSRYKCGFKLLQYMGVSIPSVASPVGVNTEIIHDGENGFLATTPAEWYDRLNLLVEDSALRSQIGMQGRKTIETHYSLENTLPVLIKTLRGVAHA